jgi:hypothetical protein
MLSRIIFDYLRILIFRGKYSKKEKEIIDRGPDAKWECNLCNRRFRIRDSVISHIRKNHLEDAEKLKAEGKQSSNLCTFLGTADEFHKLKFKFGCPYCEESYSHYSTLRSHINRTHEENGMNEGAPKPKPPQDEKVGNFLITYGVKSPKVQNHKCHACPKRFINYPSLARHIKQKHEHAGRKVLVDSCSEADLPCTSDEDLVILKTNIVEPPKNVRGADRMAKNLVHRATSFLRNGSRTGHCRDTFVDRQESMDVLKEYEIKQESSEFEETFPVSSHCPQSISRTFSCLLCGDKPSFKLFASLAKHFVSVHDTEVFVKDGPQDGLWEVIENPDESDRYSVPRKASVSYSCKICSLVLPDVRSLPRHMLKAHGKIVHVKQIRRLPFKNYDGPAKEWLEIVKKYNEGNESRSFPKDDSEQGSNNIKEDEELEKRRISLYVLAQKYKIEKFPCQSCKEVLETFHDWNRHNLTRHATGFKCKNCGRGLASRLNLENHVRSLHNPGWIRICKGCKVVFKKIEEFQRHLKLPKCLPACQENAVPCEEEPCKSRKHSYTTPESLAVHMDIYHAPAPAPYQCSKCDKSFNFKFKWIEHENVHLGKEACICEVCGKQFNARSRLRIHMIMQHLSNREYSCTICKKAFPTKSGLRRHQKLHLPDSPHQCPICGKTFKLTNYLTIHMWSHDPDRHEKYSLYKPKSSKRKPENSTSTSNIGKRSRPRVAVVVDTLETVDTQASVHKDESHQRTQRVSRKRPKKYESSSESEQD